MKYHIDAFSVVKRPFQYREKRLYSIEKNGFEFLKKFRSFFLILFSIFFVLVFNFVFTKTVIQFSYFVFNAEYDLCFVFFQSMVGTFCATCSLTGYPCFYFLSSKTGLNILISQITSVKIG